MSFCNFNSKSDGRLDDFFSFLPFPLQNLVQRLRSQTPSSVLRPPARIRQSLAYFSAIPCEPCSRYFFCYGEIFLPNMRGPLGCLLGFWPFGPKPCGGKNNLSKFIITSFILILHTAQFWHGAAPISPPCRKFMQVKQNHVARLMFFASIRGKDIESALPLLNSENH